MQIAEGQPVATQTCTEVAHAYSQLAVGHLCGNEVLVAACIEGNRASFSHLGNPTDDVLSFVQLVGAFADTVYAGLGIIL